VIPEVGGSGGLKVGGKMSMSVGEREGSRGEDSSWDFGRRRNIAGG